MRALSKSTSSSSGTSASNSTASSSTSSSSTSGSSSSSSDSETSQESAVEGNRESTKDVGVSKPPFKKARVAKTSVSHTDPCANKDFATEQNIMIKPNNCSPRPSLTSGKCEVKKEPCTPTSESTIGFESKSRLTRARFKPRTCVVKPLAHSRNALKPVGLTGACYSGTKSTQKPVTTLKCDTTQKRPSQPKSGFTSSEAESISDCDGPMENDIDSNHKVRKKTRSCTNVDSKHSTTSGESDSENIPSSKVKKNSWADVCLPEVLIKDQQCPLRDCNSSGHLGGRLEKHFTKEACPMYHNRTIQECEAAFCRRQKKENDRPATTIKVENFVSEKAHKPNNLKNSEPNSDIYSSKEIKLQQLHGALPDSKNTNEVRSVTNIPNKINEQIDYDLNPVNREPNLIGAAPDNDLYLFREAQAIASETIEHDQNLPYSIGTKLIEIGKHNIQVWYQSPYPEEFAHAPKLYICEYCLHYMKSKTTSQRHTLKCVWRYPPGDEIYRNQKTSVWEVDGKHHKEYCQKLCLLAKFFLDHKTLYDNVEPFFFYVMTRLDSNGCHAVGYFSKEKNSSMNYNVSCILTFPHYQRQGYGRLLIDFSYLLTRVEGKIGTPEKPLSDLGLISYRSYWKDVLLKYLQTFTGQELSIKDISQETGINSSDIVSTLQALSMIKYWKGKHIILKKQDVIDEYVERFTKHGNKNKHIDTSLLKWTPKSQ